MEDVKLQVEMTADLALEEMLPGPVRIQVNRTPESSELNPKLEMTGRP